MDSSSMSPLQGDDGLHLAKTLELDLIILDVMLPNVNGWSILSDLRQSGRQTAVLFLTAQIRWMTG